MKVDVKARSLRFTRIASVISQIALPKHCKGYDQSADLLGAAPEADAIMRHAYFFIERPEG